MQHRPQGQERTEIDEHTVTRRTLPIETNGHAALEVTEKHPVHLIAVTETTLRIQSISQEVLHGVGLQSAIAVDPTNGTLYAIGPAGSICILPEHPALKKELEKSENEEIIEK